MTLSVIIPVYNVLNYLERCLDSIINQTFQDMEIIIVDDGSTDGSAEFVDDFSKKDNRFKVIHKNNGGLMSAWTTGVRASHGNYIGFIDSDDYALPQMFERLITLAKEQEVDIVISNYLINGKEKSSHPLSVKRYEGNDLIENIQKHIFPSPLTYSISMQRMPKLFKREIIVDNLKYTVSLSRTFEDRYIVPAALLSAGSIFYTDEAFYCWILREGSNHGMYKEHLLDDIRRVYYVQQQVVKDKMPALMPQWELAYLDFIRLYVERNIIRIKDVRVKVKSAKALFGDSLTKERMNKYGHLMNAKMGKVLRFTYKHNMPWLLALLSYIPKAEK